MRKEIVVKKNKVIITEKQDDIYEVSLTDSLGDTYKGVCHSWYELGSWVYEMADNNDIGSELNHKMCAAFGKEFGKDGGSDKEEESMSLEEKVGELEELKAEQSYLYDCFVRASTGRAGSILEKLCKVDKQIADLRKEIKDEKKYAL